MTEPSAIFKTDEHNRRRQQALSLRLGGGGGVLALGLVAALGLGGASPEDARRPPSEDTTQNEPEHASELLPAGTDVIASEVRRGQEAHYAWDGELSVASPSSRRDFETSGGLVAVTVRLSNPAAGVELIVGDETHTIERSRELYGVVDEGVLPVILYRTEQVDATFQVEVNYPG